MWSTLRKAYMFITNYLIIVGFVLQAIYCFQSIGRPDAMIKITNTAPVMGEIRNEVKFWTT